MKKTIKQIGCMLCVFCLCFLAIGLTGCEKLLNNNNNNNKSSGEKNAYSNEKIAELLNDSVAASIGAENVRVNDNNEIEATVSNDVTTFNLDSLLGDLSEVIVYEDWKMTKRISGDVELQEGENVFYVKARKEGSHTEIRLMIVRDALKLIKLRTPLPEIDRNGTVIWEPIEGAASYWVTVYKTDDGSVISEVELAVNGCRILIGQSIDVVALPAAEDLEKYTESDRSEKVSYIDVLPLIEKTWRDAERTFDVLKKMHDELYFDVGNEYFIEVNGERRSATVSQKANVSANAPEFMYNVKLDEKDCASFGYSENFVSVKGDLDLFGEPLIDNAFKIDVTALSECASMFNDRIVESVTKKKNDIELFKAFFSNSVFSILGNIFDYEEQDNKKIVSVPVGALSGGIMSLNKIMPSMLEDMLVSLIPYVDCFYLLTDVLGLERVQIDGEDLSVAVILSLILNGEIRNNKLLNFEFVYENDVVKEISYVLDIGALGIPGVECKIGWTTKIDHLSTTSPVTIDTDGYTAQDLEFDLGVALGVKDLAVDVKTKIRLSDAFANKTNKWITIEATSGENTATAYFDATGLYADFGGLFDILGIDKTAYKTRYVEKITDEEGNEINLIDEILTNMAEMIDTLDGLFEGKEDESNEDNILNTLMIIWSGYIQSPNKADYISLLILSIIKSFDPTIGDHHESPQQDLLNYVFLRKVGDTGTCLADYALFYLNENGDAATFFERLFSNLRKCHEAGKRAYEAAFSTSDNLIGIQILADGEDNDLLDYLSYFFMLPTVTENAETHEYEIDYDDLTAFNDVNNLKRWLNKVFPTTNKYRKLVEDILGVTLNEFIDGGIYLEAIDDGGFHGTLRIATDSSENADEYVRLSAGVGMTAYVSDSMDAIEGIEFGEKNTETDKYYIEEMAQALLDGLRAYHP